MFISLFRFFLYIFVNSFRAGHLFEPRYLHHWWCNRFQAPNGRLLYLRACCLRFYRRRRLRLAHRSLCRRTITWCPRSATHSRQPWHRFTPPLLVPLPSQSSARTARYPQWCRVGPRRRLQAGSARRRFSRSRRFSTRTLLNSSRLPLQRRHAPHTSPMWTSPAAARVQNPSAAVARRQPSRSPFRRASRVLSHWEPRRPFNRIAVARRRLSQSFHFQPTCWCTTCSPTPALQHLSIAPPRLRLRASRWVSSRWDRWRRQMRSSQQLLRQSKALLRERRRRPATRRSISTRSASPSLVPDSVYLHFTCVQYARIRIHVYEYLGLNYWIWVYRILILIN